MGGKLSTSHSRSPFRARCRRTVTVTQRFRHTVIAGINFEFASITMLRGRGQLVLWHGSLMALARHGAEWRFADQAQGTNTTRTQLCAISLLASDHDRGGHRHLVYHLLHTTGTHATQGCSTGTDSRLFNGHVHLIHLRSLDERFPQESAFTLPLQ
jgi:hypothetical protein